MLKFHVANGIYPIDEFDDVAIIVEANDSKMAAESFVESHHADFDWEVECVVRTRILGSSMFRLWDVIVASVPEATATLRE